MVRVCCPAYTKGLYWKPYEGDKRLEVSNFERVRTNSISEETATGL